MCDLYSTPSLLYKKAYVWKAQGHPLIISGEMGYFLQPIFGDFNALEMRTLTGQSCIIRFLWCMILRSVCELISSELGDKVDETSSEMIETTHRKQY